jgi:hypothetical protein
LAFRALRENLDIGIKTVVAAMTKQSGHLLTTGAALETSSSIDRRRFSLMTVRHFQVPDNSGHDDGLTGWKRIVAAIVIAAAAIVTLWLTDSIEHTTAVVLLVLVPLGVGVTMRK